MRSRLPARARAHLHDNGRGTGEQERRGRSWVRSVAKAKPKTPKDASSPSRPLILETTTQFDRHLKRQEKRGKSLDKLHSVIETLRNRRPLDLQSRDHPLGGELQGGARSTQAALGPFLRFGMHKSQFTASEQARRPRPAPCLFPLAIPQWCIRRENRGELRALWPDSR